MSNDIKIDGISYMLNEAQKEAAIIRYDSATKDIFIPGSIIYKSKKYIITRICKDSFSFSEIKTVTFADDSEIQIIGEKAFINSDLESISLPQSLTEIDMHAFACCTQLKNVIIPKNSNLKIFRLSFFGSPIESIFIPPHVENLQEEWFSGLLKLTNVKVSQQNIFFSNYENILVAKSDKNKPNYDILRFVPRNISEVQIPSFIEKIAPFSFEFCVNIQKVRFSKDSKLRTIENFAFSNSSINAISIPKTVTKICIRAFSYCKKLNQIFFSKKSELKIIEKYAFANSSLGCITIPSNVEKIEIYAFHCCRNLQIVEFESHSKVQSINKDIFSDLTQVIVYIPFKSKIKIA